MAFFGGHLKFNSFFCVNPVDQKKGPPFSGPFSIKTNQPYRKSVTRFTGPESQIRVNTYHKANAMPPTNSSKLKELMGLCVKIVPNWEKQTQNFHRKGAVAQGRRRVISIQISSVFCYIFKKYRIKLLVLT